MAIGMSYVFGPCSFFFFFFFFLTSLPSLSLHILCLWILPIFVVCSGVLHGGDSDSTGTMCCAWYGTMYGFKGMTLIRCFVCDSSHGLWCMYICIGVPDCNHSMLEYRTQLVDLGKALYARYGTIMLPSSTAPPTAASSSPAVAISTPATTTTTT
jgi:hypothetical protein